MLTLTAIIIMSSYFYLTNLFVKKCTDEILKELKKNNFKKKEERNE